MLSYSYKPGIYLSRELNELNNLRISETKDIPCGMETKTNEETTVNTSICS